MAAASNPPTTEEKPAPAAPAEPATVTAAKPVLAADFVSQDKDDLRADETPGPLDDILPDDHPAPAGEKKGGRPRSDNPSKEALRSRRRYEARKAAREGAKPGFADLPGGKGPGAPASDPVAPPPPAPPSAPPVNYRANAEGCVMLVTGLLSATVSSEWAPRSEAEKNSVVDPLARYMEVNKWDDISPGWILTFALVAYSLPRFSMPETKAKLDTLAKFAGLKKDDKPQQQTTE